MGVANEAPPRAEHDEEYSEHDADPHASGPAAPAPRPAKARKVSIASYNTT